MTSNRISQDRSMTNPIKPVRIVHLDMLHRRFISDGDKTYLLALYGDLKEEKPIGVMKETVSKIVINPTKNRTWTDYNFDLKHRVDTATGTELDLAAYDLETYNGDHGYRRFSKDEDIRHWLQSTKTYQAL